MSDYFRGDVIVADLEPTRGSEQKGARPCVVVSADSVNQSLPLVIVAPITDATHLKRSRFGATFIPSGEGGLVKDSLALAIQTRTIAIERIIRKLGVLSEQRMEEVGRSLSVVLDLDD